jgi:hypothetical protein
MDLEGSLLYSHEPTSELCPEPVECVYTLSSYTIIYSKQYVTEWASIVINALLIL